MKNIRKYLITGLILALAIPAIAGQQVIPTGGIISTLSAGSLPSGINATKIANGSVSNTEFQYLDGASSNLQTQITALAGGTPAGSTGQIQVNNAGALGASANLAYTLTGGFAGKFIALNSAGAGVYSDPGLGTYFLGDGNDSAGGTYVSVADTTNQVLLVGNTKPIAVFTGVSSATDHFTFTNSTTGALIISGASSSGVNSKTIVLRPTNLGSVTIDEGTGVDLKAGAVGELQVRFYDADNSANVSVSAPATLTGSRSITWGDRSGTPLVSTDLVADKTITAGATTGAQTINKPAGSVNFAAAAASLVVTNSLVSTSSVILCTIATNDTTFTSAQCVAGSGSFTIYANVAATAETRVNFLVIN